MLYLVTIPPELQPGSYRCEQITTDQAVSLITASNEAGTMQSFVNFGSTRFAIQKLTGIKVDIVQKISLPSPKSGDAFLCIRVGPKPKGERISSEDLQFYKIEFTSL